MTHPACYGSPTAVSHLCETCRACPAVGACIRQAFSFLDSLPNSPLVQGERQRLSLSRQALSEAPRAALGSGSPKRIGLTANQEAAIKAVGKSVGSMARQLFERGWFDFARSEIEAGRNPGRNDWQRIFCQALIGGGISRDALQIAYQEQLNLTPGSARVRVSKAVSLFLIGQLVTEFDGKLQFSRNASET